MPLGNTQKEAKGPNDICPEVLENLVLCHLQNVSCPFQAMWPGLIHTL